MTAEISVFPVINTRADLLRNLVISLSEANQARLARRAVQWGVSPQEAAEMMLADLLNPQGQRRQRKLVSVEIAISMGLTTCVPGPASLVGPRGKAVGQVKEGLRLAGYRIEPV